MEIMAVHIDQNQSGHLASAWQKDGRFCIDWYWGMLQSRNVSDYTVFVANNVHVSELSTKLICIHILVNVCVENDFCCFDIVSNYIESCTEFGYMVDFYRRMSLLVHFCYHPV